MLTSYYINGLGEDERLPPGATGRDVYAMLVAGLGQADRGLPPGTTGRDVYALLVPGLGGYGLGQFDASVYQGFVSGGKTAKYKDDLVTCAKDDENRPVCRLIVEDTSTKRKAGQVAAMQAAADAFLNKVPMFQDLGVAVPTATGEMTGADFARKVQLAGGGLPDPIGRRAGYDGWVGPSAFGFIAVAMDIASHLAPEAINGSVAASLNQFNEASMTRYAAANADFLRYITENFNALLERYKKNPPPSPMLVPVSVPIIAKALGVKKKKRYAGLIAGVSIAAAGLMGLGIAAMKSRMAAEEGELPEEPLLPEEMF